MQCAESMRVQAYFDGEMDAVSASQIERHSEHCAECRDQLQDLERVRAGMRQNLTHPVAPPELRARIARALDQETEGTDPRPRPGRWSSSGWRSRPFWLGACSGLGSAALVAGVAIYLFSSTANPLLDELVGAHVRSLMPSHLIDVVSTDRHTVKPWFAGHADVSPAVADFAQQGYRLLGGRADYLDHQRSAVVVYQHGAHLINVFSWAAGKRSVPQATSRSGYHIACWKVGDLGYCAVSDTDWPELAGLVRLLQDLGSRE